jgi:PIN domain nuclease of toxin-antitoxin system
LKLLLDTCTVIWAVYETGRLSPVVRELLQDQGNTRVISSVTVWEICVKHSLGKLNLDRSSKEFVKIASRSLVAKTLSFSSLHALESPELPPLHRDPFDRMLVCQAIAHDLTILTPDPQIRSYPVKTIW